jgi:hypothetical protein
LAEGFLFAVAASLIVSETWRSSRSESKRREGITERLDDLEMRLEQLSTRLDDLLESVGSEMSRQDQRSDELAKILEHVIQINATAEFRDTPLRTAHVSPALTSSNTLPVMTDTHSSELPKP